MSFKQSVAICFRKYAKFKGRARRSEYWFFYLFNTLVTGPGKVLLQSMPLSTFARSIASVLPSKD